jgi:hypothetical protein
MGTVQTKDTISSTMTTPIKSNQFNEHPHTSIQSILSASLEDPRSPGGRRTPVHSPGFNRNTREKMLKRLGAAAAMDPRSPSSRTPLNLSAADTPSPLSLDPRSPYVARTPLALSAQEVAENIEQAEVVAVTEDVIIIDKPGMYVAEGAQVSESAAVESTSDRVTVETFNSPEISATILALVMSPLNSPSLGGRKRRDILRGSGLSPLKKSYSAPNDENKSHTPLSKSAANPRNARTPLSPINRSLNSRTCAGVQPIKFRMDPGILG